MPTDAVPTKVVSFPRRTDDRSLVLRLPDTRSPTSFQDIDLSPWRERPRLAVALRAYFENQLAALTPGSRVTQLELLDVFRDFLDRDGQPVRGLLDVFPAVVARYKVWLDEQRNRRPKGEEPSFWSESTKTLRYNALVSFLDFCWATPTLRSEMQPDMTYKRNPWPRSHLKTKHHEAMPKVDLDRVRTACIRDIQETKRRLEHGEAVRANDSIKAPPRDECSTKPYDDPDVRLRALMEWHNDLGPSHDRLKDKNPGLALSVLKSAGRGFEVASYLHLTARRLVPFVLLLAMDTAFNPETILNIDLSDIEREHPLWGKERWLLGGEKRRAARRQHRSFPSQATDDDTPVQILKTLQRFGAHARRKLPDGQKDRVFAFWQLLGEPFASFAGRTGYKTFTRALDEFRRDHGGEELPHFTLVTLRATMAEGVDKVTKDPKAKQLALGHERLSTTLGYYDSQAAKRRRREELAVSIDLRERYARANGAADLRDRTPGADEASAATAGFGCTMPRFSPIKGQRRGQPCNAYGACPTCELAYVDLNRPLAFRRLLQLRDRIIQARDEAYPARWLEVWLPRLAALEERWLPRFDEKIVERGMALDVQSIPRVE